jgi:putative cell wall-binding protein
MRRKFRNTTLFIAAFSIAVAGVVVSGPVEPAQASSISGPATEVTSPDIVGDTGADSSVSDQDADGAAIVAPDSSARSSARAASLDFTAGNIITDANFYNGSALTAAGVQSFLTGRNPGACLTTCLENYTATTPNWPANALCSSYQGVANERASSIIAKVGSACGISPKVLLVLLQKEQSLVGSRSPSPAAYAAATGFGCPDNSTGCNPDKAGFFNQVYNAAYQFRNYGTASWANRYPVGKTTNILYNPNADCGSAPVTVSNKATQALYIYTPYQPNAAALANPYGEGDGCSAYGNRNFFTIYSGWFGDPRTPVQPTLTTSRVEGADRFVTSVELSKKTFPRTASVAYITTGASFPDALSAAPAAAVEGGPLLLTYPGELPNSVRQELLRLKPSKIVVVGGDAAVSPAVVQDLRGIQSNVKVLAGVDRFETSRMIAQEAFGGAKGAYLATGSSFPDALSAGAAAGSRKVPVVLVNSNVPTVDQATANLLRGMTDIRVVGGPAAIPDSLVSSLSSLSTQPIRRLAGADRFLTSVAINDNAFPSSKTAYLATGVSFPDALAGAAAAGFTKSPLYVSFTDCVPLAVKSSIIAKGATTVVLLGGQAALSQNVAKLGTCS